MKIKEFPSPYKKAVSLLSEISGKALSRKERVEFATLLASYLMQETIKERTKKEKKREKRLAKMIEDPKGRTFLTLMADQTFRSASLSRTADEIHYLIKKFGIPKFLDDLDLIKFMLFYLFGKTFPYLFVPEIKKNMRSEMSHVLLPDDPLKAALFFENAKKNNVRINLNHLGEAILGEEEAKRRLQIYLEDLKNPQIEYVSIKISTIYSQINQIGWQFSLKVLSERLRELYRAAKSHFFIKENGEKVPKFVNLDMEEYKDLHLTVALFQKVLSEEEFLSLSAGIVLQSYIPDSFEIQKQITTWALNRRKNGGAFIKVRIVKGANLAMETVESSIKGWSKPTFETKMETDANFKRMLEYALTKEHASAVHVGVGSHNLFDLSYALVLRSEKGLEKEIEIEMLQGMAEPMRRAVQKVSKDMLLYCPEAKEKDFQNAVAYLIRRLDENSGPENFLRDLFAIREGNLEWETQKRRFQEAANQIDTLSFEPKRKQNRFLTTSESEVEIDFKNEPDTDFSLPENRKWAQTIFQEWEKKKFQTIPLVIGDKEISGEIKKGIDPSRPSEPFYDYCIAGLDHINEAVQVAKSFESKWAALPFKERSHLLAKVAEKFRQNRNALIGAMIADAGKNVWEADPEVSEAIDFIEYYRKNWEELLSLKDLKFTPKGTVLVAPPWNFPCSIPTGSIAGALTAGNCVIFKPAPESVLVGWILVQLFWEAGIPKEALQFINCEDETSGSALIKHPGVNSVLLTGATATALKFMEMRPGLDLNAETGGKNVLIITSLSDRDLAIRDLLQSAFSHSGQKCSACSLAILEKEVYDDAHFLQQLKDAATSLIVGSAWNFETKIGPLIRPPEGALKRGLTTLEPGESWLLVPKGSKDNPHLWSCGIKLGVKKESFTHQTELFGPVLGIMRAENLEEAIALANGTPYGLTSGLHSLDEREQSLWKEKIVAGNLYINRSITGAVVRRQPFGGCKNSSFGSEAKAGGPNYTLALSHITQLTLPSVREELPSQLIPLLSHQKIASLTEEERGVWKTSAESYANWSKILKTPKDVTKVLGQGNFFFHVPRNKVYVRVTTDQILPLLQVLTACLICKSEIEVSSAESPLFSKEVNGIVWIQEKEEEFLTRMKRGRIRVIGSPSEKMVERAAKVGATLQSGPVLANGRVELLHYLREVSISHDTHRYGYLPTFPKS